MSAHPISSLFLFLMPSFTNLDEILMLSLHIHVFEALLYFFYLNIHQLSLFVLTRLRIFLLFIALLLGLFMLLLYLLVEVVSLMVFESLLLRKFDLKELEDYLD